MSSAPSSNGTSSSEILPYFGALSAAQLMTVAARPPLSLNSLLVRARDSLATVLASNAGRRRVHVIFGNEACDMDSMVCSVVLAWYLTLLYGGASGDVFVPMMNMRSSELNLRGEARLSFEMAGLDPKLLLFKEDVDFAALRAAPGVELHVILVDHNQLEAAQSALAPHISGVLDHHKDENLYPRTHRADNRIIEVQGSCSSILGEMMLRRAPQLLSEAALESSPIDYTPGAVPAPLGVVTLLWHTLLLDTSDMSPVTAKAKEKDELVFTAYQKLLRQLTHAELKRRRADISQLTTEQLLAKDTKYGESKRYPHMVASIPGSLAKWAEKEHDMLPRIEAVARAQALRFAVLLTAHTDEGGQFRREITLLVLRDSVAPASDVLDADALFAALTKGLEEAKQELDVVEDENLLPPVVRAQPHKMLVRTYQQKNVRGSRKQVAPILEGILSKL